MRLRCQGLNFFFAITLMTILLFMSVINLGNTTAFAATLTAPLAGQIQINQDNAAQPKRQISKGARETPDQLQIKDMAQAMVKQSEQPPQGMIGHITSKYQKKGKMKQPGGLKGNIGWLTF